MKKILFFILLIICMLFTVSSIAASDINNTNVIGDENAFVVASDINDVEMSSDNNNHALEANNDLIVAEGVGNFDELQSEIDNTPEKGILELHKDYKSTNNASLFSGVFINKDLTINGNGHTLDGGNVSRIFLINYGSGLQYNKVIFNNITFKNGNAKIYGGAILNFADLTVNDCTFINNYARTAGGAINSLGTLTLKNSVFNKNVAGGDAGAVFSLNVKNGFFFFKKFFDGRYASETTNLLTTLLLSFLDPQNDTISNCKFIENVANGRGGAAVYAFSHIYIDSCKFKSNKAGEMGAAVYACKNLYIKNSNFIKNQVSTYGGAVYFKCHEISGHYDANGTWVSDMVFYDNLIEGSTFSNNVAGERGGAIYGFKFSDDDPIHCAKAVKCTFSDNRAPKGKDIYGGIAKNCVYKNTKITLKTVKVKKSAKKLTLKATLKKGSSPLKAKQVTFKFNGKSYKAKTNSKGIAKCTIKKNVLKKLKVGQKVKYQAKYSRFVAKKTAKVQK